MLSGIILAGGENKRMDGEHKSLLRLGEETLIQRQVRLMRPICGEIIIVTNTPRLFWRLVDDSVRIITDYIPKKGPLGGMHAGLTLARHPEAWIVSCDMPFLSVEAAQIMLDRKRDGFEAVFPWIHGTAYPLHGIYARECAEPIGRLLDRYDIHISSLLKVLFWSEAPQYLFAPEGEDVAFVRTIKTVDDYRAVLDQLGLGQEQGQVGPR